MYCSASATLWTRSSCLIVVMSVPGRVPRGDENRKYTGCAASLPLLLLGCGTPAATVDFVRSFSLSRMEASPIMAKKAQAKEYTEFSEAQIAVHWKEEGYFKPPKQFVRQANMKDRDVRKRFGLNRFPNCFKEYADMLTWFEPYRTVLDTSNPPFWKWFVGGKINASYNCVDRHLAQYRNKAALVFVPEPEDEPTIALTYQELYVRVNEMAALLRDFCGLKAGDRVTLHLPMTLELPVTMLACARLGVIHSQVFGGFSGQACGTRIQDSGSHILISMDAYWRAGKLGDHKANAD